MRALVLLLMFVHLAFDAKHRNRTNRTGYKTRSR
jgi:hypothetical protein